jgi:hypothetical protein
MARRLAPAALLLALGACTTVTTNQLSVDANRQQTTAAALAANGTGGTPAAAPRPGASLQPIVRPAALRAPAPTAAEFGGTLPQVGRTYRGSIRFLGRDMPLPGGEWILVVQTLARFSDGTPLDQLGLVRHDGSALSGMLTMVGNPVGHPLAHGWPLNGLCRNSDVISSDVRAAEPMGAQDCQVANFLRTALWREPRETVLLRGIAHALESLNVTPPTTVVGVQTFVADGPYGIEADTFFNPDQAGVAPELAAQRNQSGWTSFNLTKDPAKAAYVDRVKAWGATWRAAMLGALAGRKPASVPPGP